MEERQKNREQFVKILKLGGHTCIEIAECYPIKVEWCGKIHVLIHTPKKLASWKSWKSRKSSKI